MWSYLGLRLAPTHPEVHLALKYLEHWAYQEVIGAVSGALQALELNLFVFVWNHLGHFVSEGLFGAVLGAHKS